MAKTNKSAAKADIPFEDKLWSAANELRGAVAENQYKDYVLSLLFVKHLSERYEIRYGQLKLELADPKSSYYTTDPKEISYVLEDPLEYQSKNVYKLPKEATWSYLLANANQDDIKVKVDNAFITIDDILAEREPDHKGLLLPIFVKSQLSPQQTAGLINLFSGEEFSEAKHPETDLYGRIYEYYLGKFAQAEGAGAGQFFTPSSIVRLLVEMIEPLSGRIMDLAIGSGGMMVQSVKFQKAHSQSPNYMVYGQERYDGNLRLCKMNLILRNMNFQVKLGDSLLDDKFPEITGSNGADYFLMNPPFNISKWHPEMLGDNDPRLFGNKETYTTDGNANYMWFQTIWYHLSPRGTAGVVMANGAMTTSNAGEKVVREYMIKNGMIDCIVQLPEKLFLTTGIPACLFILSKNRDGKDGVHRERKNEILFIDARKCGTMVTRKLRAFTDEDISKVAGTYHQWRNVGGTYADIEGFCKSATLEEVEKHNNVLTAGRYVGTEAEEDDGVPFEEKMAVLTQKLETQFLESNRLQDSIRKNLKSLGYEK
ncbi:MAG: N-6 DNA methylase [Bacteroidales bacterium]